MGDGYRRNPKEPDALLEQRTKDLQGIAGQCRGFDRQEFCSDWERTDGKPIPWTFPSDAVPVPPGTPEANSVKKPAAPGKPRIRMAVLESDDEPARLVCPGLLEYRCMQAGITPRLTVLYLPDYVTSTTRLSSTSALWLGLGRMLPEYDISVPLVAGPFSDDEGINAFFDLSLIHI